jgi:ABC-type glutathione transport system ATPase component
MNGPVLSVRGLNVALRGRPVLTDLSIDLHAGRTLAVVGRSGSGKSTLVLALAGLLPRSAEWSAARFEIKAPGREPVDLKNATSRDFARVRARLVGVVFQEPEASLDPMFRVGDQVAEVVRAGTDVSRREARRRALALLEQAGLSQPAGFARAWPSRLSGGENQRACIAAALALSPPILLADEPTSALDLEVEAQILALLHELTASRSLATLLVTHDFDVVAEAADRVAVIANGRIVEEGPVSAVLESPRESATRELVAARLLPGAP